VFVGMTITTNAGVYTTNLFTLGIFADWVYVTADGQAPSPNNPIVGRFAYWVDDEATKVNINSAWKRASTGVGVTSTNNSALAEVDLRALELPFNGAVSGDTVADGVSNARTPHPFNTPEEVRRSGNAGLVPPDGYFSNKFYLTTFSADRNVDTWGRPRINLNTLTDPSPSGDAWKRLNDSIYSKIYPFLNVNSNSFVKKYGDANVQQILANIIDYRQADNVDATHDTLDSLEIPQTYCGLKKGPFLNEVTLHVIALGANLNAAIITTNPGPVYVTNWNVTVRAFIDVELINPFQDPVGKDYKILVEPDVANPITFQLYPATTNGATVINTGFYPPAIGGPLPQQTIPVNAGTLNVTTNVAGASFWSLSATNYSGDTTPAANWQYVPHWDSAVINYTKQTTDPAEVPGVTNIQFRINRVLLRQSDNPASIRDWATKSDFGAQPITIEKAIVWTASLGNNGSFTAFLGNNSSGANGDKTAKGIAKNDPRMRTFANNPLPGTAKAWTPTIPGSTSQGATPNSANAGAIVQHNTQGFVPYLLPDGKEAGTLQQDMLSSTFYIKQANYESPAELGFIHANVPWRTLRMQSVLAPANSVDAAGLQPAAELGAIPDWVLLDIFTTDSSSSVSGRININATIFGSNEFRRPTIEHPDVFPPRLPSLDALFYGMENTPLSYPITSPNTTKFWWGRYCNPATFNSSCKAAGWPQPSAFDVTDETNAFILGWCHDTNLPTMVRNRFFTTNSIAFPTYHYDTNTLFLTPGEICEVAGIDNGLVKYSFGIDFNGPRKADKELIARKIANLITTRSNAFTIWAVAQGIKKVDPSSTPGIFLGGKDLITGEVKVQAVVERYEDTNLPVNDPNRVKFRTKYFRYIYE
jgi:hypothetical protein